MKTLAMIARIRVEFVDTGVANATLGNIEHTLYIDFVGFVNGST